MGNDPDDYADSRGDKWPGTFNAKWRLSVREAMRYAVPGNGRNSSRQGKRLRRAG
jgi:hypothetical protein